MSRRGTSGQARVEVRINEQTTMYVSRVRAGDLVAGGRAIWDGNRLIMLGERGQDYNLRGASCSVSGHVRGAARLVDDLKRLLKTGVMTSPMMGPNSLSSPGPVIPCFLSCGFLSSVNNDSAIKKMAHNITKPA